MTFFFKNSLKLCLCKQYLRVYCLPGQQLSQQTFKTSSMILYPHKQNPSTSQQNDSKNTQKKFKESVKITLIHNENITVTGLEEAKHLAKRRSLHLVKVQDMDSKAQRPIYKLLNSAEILQNELADMEKLDKSNSDGAPKKSEKSLNISSRIADHDLQSRLKNISKWLNKKNEVRILIQSTSEQDMANSEKIFKTIEESIKKPQVIGKIVQKRAKGNIVRFSILPVTTSTSE